NKVRQAISWLRAQQTGIWHVDAHGSPVRPEYPHQNSMVVHSEPRGVPSYDFASIESFVDQVVQLECQWQGFFDTSDTRPLTVVYEDFVGTQQQTAERVLDHLHIPRPDRLQLTAKRLGRMSDDVSIEWESRYWRDRAGRPRGAP